MILGFILTNFQTLVLLGILIVILFANVNVKSSDLLWIALTMVVLLALTDYIEEVLTGRDTSLDLHLDAAAHSILLRCDQAASCILRPGIILIEILIVVKNDWYRSFCLGVYLVNAVVYGYLLVTELTPLAISDGMGWVASGMAYLVQAAFILVLLGDAVVHLWHGGGRQDILILMIALLFGMGLVLEICGVPGRHVTFLSIVCMLMYHIYMTLILQLLLTQENTKNKLQVERDRILILREQIQPHFIYNCLNIIRTLIRKDARTAVQTMDEFTTYLQAHFRAIEYDDLVGFEQELENVKVFLSLAQSDRTKRFEIVYDIEETDFSLPPLSLEPLVENAVVHGVGEKDGVISISTRSEGDRYVIDVTDTGTSERELTPRQTARLSVGVKNTRSRLALLCDGTLDVITTENGTTSRITIPKKEGDT